MIKTILLPICRKEDTEQKLDFSVQLAKMFDAHVKVLHVLTPAEIVASSVAMEAAYSIEFAEQHNKTSLEQAQNYKMICEKKFNKENVRFDWCIEKGDLLKYLYIYSRVVDLTIVGQKGGELNELLDVRNDFIIGSGRPVIAVPKNGVDNFNLNNILVAWDGGRECANAVHAALPILKEANKVVVVTITEQYKTHIPETDICLYLSRHGINVEALTLSDSILANKRILDTADTIHADLLVAGAWGHTRFSEFIFGGVTRELMRNQKKPVLFAN